MLLAEQLRAAGLACFPCWTRYVPERNAWDKGPSVPIGEHWATTAQRPLNDPILNWYSGVVGLPVPAGVVVLDLDSYKGITREAVEARFGVRLDWDAAKIQNTISGGEHYAFREPAWPVKQLTGGKDGLDTRVHGKGFICTGQGYTPAGLYGVYAMLYPHALPPLPDECRPHLERVETTPSTATMPAAGDRDVDQIIAALRHIDPGCPRSEWIRIGLALRHYFHDDEATGAALFEHWSMGEFWPEGTPANYVPHDIGKQWRSFEAEGGVTVSTLFYRAMQGGWTPPANFDSSAAFGGTGAERATFAQLVERVVESGGDVLQVESIVEDIRAAGCNALQLALLAGELKNSLKDSGLKGPLINKLVDGLLTPAGLELPRKLAGEIPAPGTVLDSATPLHPSLWARHHTKGKDQKPKGTLQNFEILLNAYGVTVTYNEIGKTLTVSGPTVPGAGTLHEEAALSYLDSLANLNEYPVAAVRAMLMPIAHRNTVNPVRQWVESTVWDGYDHVGALFSQITFAPDEDVVFCELMVRKWLRGALAIGTGRTSRWEYVLVFVDPLGGKGKTRFFATLCPPELLSDSVILDTDDRDSVKMAVSYWLTELGELDGTYSRSEQAKFKAFMSRGHDEMRLAYGRTYLKYPRRTAFLGSVNDPYFLTDPSNNRRNWGMNVTSANHMHTVDVRQVWAQVNAELCSGAMWYMTPQEEQVLAMRNEQFRSGSGVVDRLAVMGLATDENSRLMTVTEILGLAGMVNPTKAELNEAARWLRKSGLRESKWAGKRGFVATVETAQASAFKPTVVK